jgi:3-hydroxybutyryl-CoA dehydrogenase
LDVHCAAATTIYPTLSNAVAPANVLAEKVQAGCLGMKTGEGFFKWTSESAQIEQRRYAKALRKALRILPPS